MRDRFPRVGVVAFTVVEVCIYVYNSSRSVALVERREDD